MLYELINPSDHYTFHAPDDKVAAAAALLVGEGQYGAKKEDGVNVCPFLAFCSAEKASELLKDMFGEIMLAGYIKENFAAVADALDSFMIMNRRERTTYEEAIARFPDDASRESYRDAIHEKNRSSMNNIGMFAWSRAKALRKLYGTHTPDSETPSSTTSA